MSTERAASSSADSGSNLPCCTVAWREWIRTVEIEPSLYAADFARLGEQLNALLRTGARIVHFWVMVAFAASRYAFQTGPP